MSSPSHVRDNTIPVTKRVTNMGNHFKLHEGNTPNEYKRFNFS